MRARGFAFAAYTYHENHINEDFHVLVNTRKIAAAYLRGASFSRLLKMYINAEDFTADV